MASSWIKNDSIHRVMRLWHLLGLKIKMSGACVRACSAEIFQKLFMIFGRSRNYNARGLIVKYV